MGAAHPSEPHWHLILIGVDIAHQAKAGSLLLHSSLDEIDRQERLTYLESTNPANLNLYKRFGFRQTGIIESGDAPPLFTMIREPKRIH